MARITVDFSDVKPRSQFWTLRQKEGWYKAEITGVEFKKTQTDNTDMLVFSVAPEQGCYPYYVKLVPNQLWKLRALLEACGVNVPNKAMQLDPEKLKGKTLAVFLNNAEYDGKEKSDIGRVDHPDRITQWATDGSNQGGHAAADEPEVIEDYDDIL